MKLSFSNKPNKDSVCIYPIFHKTRPANNALAALLPGLARNDEFKPKKSRIFSLYGKVKGLPARLILLGLGKTSKLNVAGVMESFAAAVKIATSRHPAKISIIISEDIFPFAQSIAESVVLSCYGAAGFKTGKDAEKLKKQFALELEIVGVGGNKAARESFEKGFLVASGVNETRDWVNLPPNIGNTEFFEQKAKLIAKEIGARLIVLHKKEIEKLGMGALLGVNRGSRDGANLVIIDYSPKGAPKDAAPIIFVGKGLLFDSGGYNLKPSGHIENMHTDKAGAMTVFGVMKLVAKMGIKYRVIGVAPFTENLIGKDALKPSEIVKSYAGKTIEITNTDAEGRLILADAIAYAVDKFKPKYLIDIATLTGACIVALGNRYAGLFGNDKDLIECLRTSGEEVDELLWPMPMHPDYDKKVKGTFADLQNADSTDRYAGASKGAAFIKQFVGKTKWAHLDIAGPSHTKDPKPYEKKGGTGFGVRVLLRFLEKSTMGA